MRRRSPGRVIEAWIAFQAGSRYRCIRSVRSRRAWAWHIGWTRVDRVLNELWRGNEVEAGGCRITCGWLREPDSGAVRADRRAAGLPGVAANDDDVVEWNRRTC
jgi:hypothetical protein